jgi:hypothetical protein
MRLIQTVRAIYDPLHGVHPPNDSGLEELLGIIQERIDKLSKVMAKVGAAGEDNRE